jgi:transposase
MAFVKTDEVITSSGNKYKYLRIVESVREKGKVKQKTIAQLGNIEVLRKDIKQIVNGLLRACDEKPLTFPEDGRLIATKQYGVRYVAQAIWERLGLHEIIKRHLKKRRASVRYEGWSLMMVINKLSDPVSKLGIFRWLNGIYWPEHGFNPLLFEDSITEEEYLECAKGEVMKFYRAMDHLLSLKDTIEIHLYRELRDLFSLKVDLVFYDLTSSYFEGNGPEGLAELGYSRDHEPGKKQVVIGLIMCNGMPIGHEVFEGSRVDKKTVGGVLKGLKERYEIGRCIFVGDRGLVTKANLEEIEKEGFDSILALKKRRNAEVKGIVLDTAPYVYCIEGKELWWREIKTAVGTRYIVCRNPEVAEIQKQMREDNIKALMDGLKKVKEGVEKLKRKASLKRVISQAEEVLRHKHGRRLIDYTVDEKTGIIKYWIKEQSIKIEEALDGVYILKTGDLEMGAKAVIDAYKDLTDVERAFRTMKSVLALRPFYHWTEHRVRAHAFICYLAFLIDRYVKRAIETHNAGFSSTVAFESLSQHGAATIDVDGGRYTYISEPSRRDRITFNSLGIKSPPRWMAEKIEKGM